MQNVLCDTPINHHEGGTYTMRDFKILQGANNSLSTKVDGQNSSAITSDSNVDINNINKGSLASNRIISTKSKIDSCEPAPRTFRKIPCKANKSNCMNNSNENVISHCTKSTV